MSDPRCDRHRQRLSLQVDGELPSGEALLLRAHLVSCPDCRLFRGEIRGLATAMRSGPLARPQPWRVPFRPVRPLARPLLAGAGVVTTALAVSIGAFVIAAGAPAKPGALSPVEGMPVYTEPYQQQGMPVYVSPFL